MGSKNLLKLVLQNQGGSQKDLASNLDVSSAQISKWKSGEYISLDMESKLRLMAGIGERDPDVVFWTGGNEQADKWDKLVRYLAKKANERSRCRHYSPLNELEEINITWQVLYSLIEAGAAIPKQFPSEIDFDYESESEENTSVFELLYEKNEFSTLIYRILKTFDKLYDFYKQYLDELIYDDKLELDTSGAINIEHCLFDLAIAKTGEGVTLLSRFNTFRHKTLKEFQDWIEIVKLKAIENGIPLKVELMNIVSNETESLRKQVESDTQSFNSKRLHPDIYMDEILRSHRKIQQVLPVICKKLGIAD